MEYFISPTKGRLSFDEVFEDMIAYVQEQTEAKYKVIIGTDSQYSQDNTCFVTAIIVHRIGKARHYYTRGVYGQISRQRSYETSAASPWLVDR